MYKCTEAVHSEMCTAYPHLVLHNFQLTFDICELNQHIPVTLDLLADNVILVL